MSDPKTRPTGPLDAEQIRSFHRDGYLVVRGLFSLSEIDHLKDRARRDRELDRAARSVDDGEGHRVRMSLWNHPGEGLYGAFSRCRRVVDSIEQLLDDEVYHYHSKMILKDAKVGGAWAWHQDYGYWYQNGLLYPDLASVMIAVDAATPENGCLELLEGSHKLGRINHVLTGDQAGADVERVAQAEARLNKVQAVLDPGDAVFFHCNTLHRSGPNDSTKPRWAMVCCYNTAHNDPYEESHHPGYTPLRKLDDEEVLRIAESGDVSVVYEDLEATDKSATSLKTG